ncbi:MAG: glycosyl hydrolase, partial [Acidobacteria bacterium]|nr:glycosyl hydrolase [Acidobacteriota bacterium]
VPLAVQLDPRVKTPAADLQKQFDLLMQIRARVNDVHDAINNMKDLRTQIQALRKRHEKNDKAKDLLAQADAVEKKLAPIEQELYQTKAQSGQDLLNWPIQLNNKLVALAGVVESADTAPTQQSYDVFKYLTGKLDPVMAKWKDVRDKDVPALNKQARDVELPAVTLVKP